MTKRRAPVSVEQALTTIAGLIGFPAMAQALTAPGRKVADRTVRDWSDPDVQAGVTLDDALTLDLAYRAAGGEGAPLFEVYALRLELARERVFADQDALTRQVMTVIQETSEATQAQLACTLPGATPALREAAIRETEEAIAAVTNTLALLRQGAGLCTGVERGVGEHQP